MAAAVLAIFSIGVNAGAYINYCDNAVVSDDWAGDYPSGLKVLGEQFDEALELQQEQHTGQTTEAEIAATGEEPTPETDSNEILSGLYAERIQLFNEFTQLADELEYKTAEMLIDYDILLKKLDIAYDEYKSCKQHLVSVSEQFRVGECSRSEVEAAEKSVEAVYYDIQQLLYEISILKTDIEAVMGEPLKSDFDFSQVYMITDAIKLLPDSLSGISGGASLCVPDGAEPIYYETADISEEYNAAVKCYYALGNAMREYISATADVRSGEAAFRLGTVTSDELTALMTEKTNAYMNASQAKADYAKSLLQLDKASGGALTGSGMRRVIFSRTKAYRSAVSEKQSGSGLWLIAGNPSGNRLIAAVLPADMKLDEDDHVSFKMYYNGNLISDGGYISMPEYIDGCDYAKLVFYINGKKAGAYKIDVFSPYGEFIS